MTFVAEYHHLAPFSLQEEDEAETAPPQIAASIQGANVDGTTTGCAHLAVADANKEAAAEVDDTAVAAAVAILGEDASSLVAVAGPDPVAASEEAKEGEAEYSEGAIPEPARMDVLSGRGAAVNAHEGNKRFRALCFSRKPEFDAGNLAAKRRVAVEIVRLAVNEWGTRFLKRTKDRGPWYEMDEQHAIVKATQTMRDFRRPDRVGLYDPLSADGKLKKRRASATPMDDVVMPEAPLEPISENPSGVHDHDVLCGRGAFVNGHIGNKRLRTLAVERKALFDAGNYTEKRGLATEIISIIRNLDPPGRFLQKAKAQSTEGDGTRGTEWEELTDEKTIDKTCQVMRDIDREDRKYRIARREQRDAQRKIRQLMNAVAQHGDDPSQEAIVAALESTTDASEAADEAVAAAEAIMDKALDDVDTTDGISGPTGEPTSEDQTHDHGPSVWV